MKNEYRRLGVVDKGTFDKCKITVSRQNSRNCNEDSPKECNIHSDDNEKDHQPNQPCRVFECSCHVTYQRGKSNSLPAINNHNSNALKTAFSKRSVPSQSNKFEKVHSSLHSAEEGNRSGPVLDSIDFFMDIETRSRSGTHRQKEHHQLNNNDYRHRQKEHHQLNTLLTRTPPTDYASDYRQKERTPPTE
ncbi:unnamed protein product [Mytilus edulis]|uniref:Uncharacterized protein n=1 Tax=Mytilus edulis TaxID=6550 RepID=A0A8S3TJX8_MYTED|nr:unnamed protein product [Mytilus edulis]